MEELEKKKGVRLSFRMNGDGRPFSEIVWRRQCRRERRDGDPFGSRLSKNTHQYFVGNEGVKLWADLRAGRNHANRSALWPLRNLGTISAKKWGCYSLPWSRFDGAPSCRHTRFH